MLEFSTWIVDSIAHGIQNPRMSLIPLHRAICKTSLKFYVYYTEYALLFKTVCTNKMHFSTHVKITRWWKSEANKLSKHTCHFLTISSIWKKNARRYKLGINSILLLKNPFSITLYISPRSGICVGMYRFKSFPKDISVTNEWLQLTYWWIWLWGNIRYRSALDSETRTTLSGSENFSMLRSASVSTSVILAGKGDSRRRSTTRFSENVADKWRTFIILRSGEDLTSFNKDNSRNFYSEKK